MAWFKKAEDDERLSLEQVRIRNLDSQQKQEENQKNVEWIRTTPHSEVLAILASYKTDVEELSAGNPLAYVSGEVYNEILSKIDAIIQNFTVIDRRLLSEQDAILVFDIVKTGILKVIHKVASESVHTRNLSIFYYKGKPSYDDEMKKMLKDLIEIRFQQKTPSNSIMSSQVQLGNGSTVSFPSMIFDDPELTTACERLERLWIKASSQRNNVEDEYFLEETATNYLPEAKKMFLTFDIASPDIRAKATQIFIDQISLIEQRIQVILSASYADMLVSFSSQTDFFKTKFESSI